MMEVDDLVLIPHPASQWPVQENVGAVLTVVRYEGVALL
jgi:hypothetical protein